jgi:hypothetical protein
MSIWTRSEEPRTPENPQDKIDGIRGWLEEQLGGQASVYSDSDRRVEVFRVEGEGEPLSARLAGLGFRDEPEPELHVTTRALEAFDLERIIEDLEQQMVPKRLRENPTVQLLYDETHVCNPIS